MHRRIWFGFFLMFLVGFVATEEYRLVENRSFVAGERLEYRVHYGIINAAEAIVQVDNNILKINNRPCYNVKVFGRTTGAFDLITKVRDTWQSYIDTAAIVPQQFYTNKREGGYKNVERAQRFELDDAKQTSYPIPTNVQDVVSGYYYLRTLAFEKMKPGQVVAVKAFFEGDVYDMRMKYAGKEKVKTRYGYAKAYKIFPILPNNGFFEDQNSIRIWVSEDQNKIPLKIEVDLKIGQLSMDLKKYSGLKNPLIFN
jgi:hypothetical protein